MIPLFYKEIHHIKLQSNFECWSLTLTNDLFALPWVCNLLKNKSVLHEIMSKWRVNSPQLKVNLIHYSRNYIHLENHILGKKMWWLLVLVELGYWIFPGKIWKCSYTVRAKTDKRSHKVLKFFSGMLHKY